MAPPSQATGYRTVNSLMMELSILHLCQPLYIQPLSSPVTAGLNVTCTVPSTEYLYGQPSLVPSLTFPGAQLVVNDGTSTEAITVLSVISDTQFTADFQLSHAAGIVLMGATFPSQSTTDPLLTQNEVLDYIARAQNEFLAQCPCISQLFYQLASIGTIYQPLTSAAIEINRIASSSLSIPVDTLTRISGTVTASCLTPHGLNVGQKFSILTVVPTGDQSFVGAFKVVTIPDAETWTYQQIAPDALTFGATAGVWVRAYEVSQQELSCQNPSWRSQSTTSIKSFYQDRTGLYQFGVNGIPAATFPVEILASIRDTDSLALTDGFAVSDLLLPYIKYKVLSYIWSKDGEMKDPIRAKYADMRFNRGVMTMRRWLTWAGIRGPISDAETMGAAK